MSVCVLSNSFVSFYSGRSFFKASGLACMLSVSSVAWTQAHRTMGLPFGIENEHVNYPMESVGFLFTKIGLAFQR